MRISLLPTNATGNWPNLSKNQEIKFIASSCIVFFRSDAIWNVENNTHENEDRIQINFKMETHFAYYYKMFSYVTTRVACWFNLDYDTN